jgi:hypothetical protein
MALNKRANIRHFFAKHIKYFLKATCSSLVARVNWEQFEYYENDIYIVSYPKSGNTWVTFMVANLLEGNTITTTRQMQNTIFGINSPVARLQAQKHSKHRVFTCHFPFNFNMRKVIYLVRDPRSVAVSNWFFRKKKNIIDDEYPFSEFLRLFLTPRNYSTKFGCWQENAGSWIGARNGTPDFLLLRYEDILHLTAEKVKTIAHFINVNYNEQSLAKTIEIGSFKNMRKMGEKNVKKNQGERNDIKFVRKADPNEWKEYFSREDHELLVEKCGYIMELLGYNTSYDISNSGENDNY